MKRKLIKGSIIVIFLLMSLTFLYPFFWIIISSFKETNDIVARPFALPTTINFDNYKEAFKAFPFVRYYTNSLIYTIVSVAILLLTSSMLAYSLARMKWKMSTAVLGYISAGLIIPIQVIIIPLYMILNTLGLRKSYMGLITPYVAMSMAMAVLLLYAFLRNLPFEMEEAACLDGCSVYSSFFRIILPMLKPALFTQSIISFMSIWNEFYLASVLVPTDKLRTVTIGLQSFFASIGTTEWGLLAATMLMASIPTLVVYLIFNGQIEEALTSGALK